MSARIPETDIICLVSLLRESTIKILLFLRKLVEEFSVRQLIVSMVYGK